MRYLNANTQKRKKKETDVDVIFRWFGKICARVRFGEPEEEKKSCVDLASASVSVVLSAFFFLFFSVVCFLCDQLVLLSGAVCGQEPQQGRTDAAAWSRSEAEERGECELLSRLQRKARRHASEY